MRNVLEITLCNAIRKGGCELTLVMIKTLRGFMYTYDTRVHIPCRMKCQMNNCFKVRFIH